MKLVTTAQMRDLEQAAVDGGATWAGLMEQAGQAVAREAQSLLESAPGRNVLMLVGPGNNGGDGLVAARALHDAGAYVVLYIWRRRASGDDQNWRLCRERGIPEYEASADPAQTDLKRLLAEATLVIDALLGMGISRAVEGELATIVGAVNNAPLSARVLAIDLPTGVHSDTGQILGTALRADVSVATGPAKRGLIYYPG